MAKGLDPFTLLLLFKAFGSKSKESLPSGDGLTSWGPFIGVVSTVIGIGCFQALTEVRPDSQKVWEMNNEIFLRRQEADLEQKIVNCRGSFFRPNSSCEITYMKLGLLPIRPGYEHFRNGSTVCNINFGRVACTYTPPTPR